MLKLILGAVAVLGLVLIFSGSPANADTIGPNCGTCGGVVYTVTFAASGAPVNGLQLYDFDVQIDTTGIDKTNYPGAQVLTAVALKVSGSVGPGTLVSAPSVGGWTLVLGGTNSGGCKLNTSNGFGCAGATVVSSGTGSAFGVPTGAAGDIYNFIFGFVLPAGSSGDLVTGGSLKAVYDTTSGGFGGLQTSETFPTAVSESGSLSLLAAGLLLTGAIRKRQFQASQA